VFNYEEIHKEIKESVGWDVPFRKLKFIYEHQNWQQVKPDIDMFNNFNAVDTACSSGRFIHDLACTTDYSFWTAMKQTQPSEDLYQFIDYATQSLKTSIHHFHFNFDLIINFIDFIGGVLCFF
jgi:hypothetical protein